MAMLEDEPNLLTAVEKQQIGGEVLDEVSGWPARPMLQDPHHFGHSGERFNQVYVEARGCWS